MHNSLPRQTLDDVPSKFFGHINCRFADQSVQPYKTILGRSSYDILTLSWLRDPSITLCSADSLPSCFSCITISFADIRSVLFTFPARKKPSKIPIGQFVLSKVMVLFDLSLESWENSILNSVLYGQKHQELAYVKVLRSALKCQLENNAPIHLYTARDYVLVPDEQQRSRPGSL
ncbi:unnamed protein product [Rhizophagus irregularis]|nr:unnamed protein product [Rhizophagus irregularis]